MLVHNTPTMFINKDLMSHSNIHLFLLMGFQDTDSGIAIHYVVTLYKILQFSCLNANKAFAIYCMINWLNINHK